MPVKKHAVEIYKNYTIYVVAGISPTMFIAEKSDPSKGATLVGDSLEELKSSILQQFYIYRRNNIPVYNGNVYRFCHKGI